MINTNVIETFLQLVQIDSPTGFEREMSLEVFRQLKDLGLTPRIDSNNNVIALVNGNGKGQPIMLNAHLDTVEPGRNIKPQVDPDGLIHSDGTTILGADNKAGVAVILEVAKRLTKNHSVNTRPIEIVFTTSEESGNVGAVNLDYSKIRSKTGYAFDVAGGNLGDVLISSPFYNRLDIEMIGKTAHAKEPEQGINVLPAFAEAISNVGLGRISRNTLVNIGVVNSGTAVNSIPGDLIASGEVRSTNETELRNVTDSIRNEFESACLDRNIELKFNETLENAGFRLEANDSFLTKTANSVRTFGINPIFTDSFGCSDANIFAGHGIKVINIATGENGAHSLNESVKSSDLEKLVEIVIRLVTR
ncbi:MAG TPA: M20/M25/M40 family metallo-hydrolase [Patescibacteria group bacterium]|nr:M20/M25/M40 family metallo-hydrolase [Patescibacteria group bacterium]